MNFHEFVTKPHSSTTLLDGALRIRCTSKEVQMKARVCPFNKFDQIAEYLQNNLHPLTSTLAKNLSILNPKTQDKMGSEGNAMAGIKYF